MNRMPVGMAASSGLKVDVCSFPIGVDIEKKRDVNPKLINKICVNDAERGYPTYIYE